MLRSIVALIFGLLIFWLLLLAGNWILLSLTMGSSALAHAGIAPPRAYFRGNLVWSFVAAIVAGYTAAALAPAARFRHAAVLGVIVFGASVIAAKASSTPFLPTSFAIASATLAFFGMVVGGAIRHSGRPA